MADLPTLYAIDFGSNSLLAAARCDRTFESCPNERRSTWQHMLS
jgi:hypothetical protein